MEVEEDKEQEYKDKERKDFFIPLEGDTATLSPVWPSKYVQQTINSLVLFQPHFLTFNSRNAWNK